MGPRQNRVTPTGDIVAIPLRGSWMGNRGILHDDAGHVVRNHASSLWITCALSFRGWRAFQWQPHHYTVLFFHDEAVSLAAGHRPCALCRRADYVRYRDAIAATGADAIDLRLHRDRLDGRTKRTHRRPWRALPAGVFVEVDGAPALVRPHDLVPWSADSGYGLSRSRPTHGDAIVLTPATSVDGIAAGYPVQFAG